MVGKKDINELAPCGRWLHVAADGLNRLVQTLGIGMILVVNTRFLFDGLAQAAAWPGRSEVNLVSLIGNARRAQHLLGCIGDHLFGHLHDVVVIGVGLVEFQLRELRVVLLGDALVAEVLADLVDSFVAADDQPLEVELIGDAEVEVLIQDVMMGDKGPGRRPAVDGLQNGRLHLQEPSLVQETAQRTDNVGSDHKNPSHFFIGDEVQVALPIAGLHIL